MRTPPLIARSAAAGALAALLATSPISPRAVAYNDVNYANAKLAAATRSKVCLLFIRVSPRQRLWRARMCVCRTYVACYVEPRAPRTLAHACVAHALRRARHSNPPACARTQARPAQVAPNYKGPTPAKKLPEEPVGEKYGFPDGGSSTKEPTRSLFGAKAPASKAAPKAPVKSEPATPAPRAAPKPKAASPKPAAAEPSLAPSSPLKRQAALRLATAPSYSDSKAKYAAAREKLVAERENSMAKAKASSPKTSRRAASKPTRQAVNTRKKTLKPVVQSRTARAKVGKARRPAPPPRRRRGGGVPLAPLAVLAAGAVLLADSPKKDE